MRGYPISCGYMGWIESEGIYRLFATEVDYREYLEDEARAQSMTEDELLAELRKRGKA